MGYVLVEVEPGVELVVDAPPDAENELIDAGRLRQVAEGTLQTLGSTIESIMGASSQVLERLDEMEVRPAEVVLTFNIQLAAEAGVVIARTQASANLGISLKWAGLNGAGPHDEDVRE